MRSGDFSARMSVVSGSEFADLTIQVNELAESIEKRYQSMASERVRWEEDTRRLTLMDERTRLAHELHDSLAQTMAGLKIQARVLDDTLHQGNEALIWQEMERIEESLDQANTELRSLIERFHAPVDSRGLIPAVESVVARFRKESQMTVFVQNEWGLDSLDDDVELQIVRIIQEALVNIHKHAQAETVRVMLRTDAGQHYRVLIEDDGVGFDQPQTGGLPGERLGLSVMQERAQRLGGDLRIESELGEGTRILLTFSSGGESTRS